MKNSTEEEGPSRDSRPQRVQLRRTKGYRKPEGAIVVSRPSKWGNPFTVINGHRQGWLIYDDRPEHRGEGYLCSYPTREAALRMAVRLFRRAMHRQIDLTELRGHDLACWCPLDQPCHADVLLQIANGSPFPLGAGLVGE